MNYGSSTYGGGGGYGNNDGGGYTNFGGSQGGSQASPSSRGQKNPTLRPVTIKQLNDASQPHPDMDFQLDGTDLHNITLIAQIRNSSHQSTNVLYTLDDGTGVLEAKYWTNKENGTDVSGSLQDGQYVRILGNLKAFNNKKHVTAQVIRPVTDFNEIPYHFLECVATHLHFTRGPKGEGADSHGVGHQKANLFGGQKDATMGGTPAYLSGLSAGAQKVFEVLRRDSDNNDGLVVDLIAQRTGLSLGDVMNAKDELLNEGKVYTTIDDNHLALLDPDY